MQFSVINLPKAVPALPDRPPQETIPQTRAEREGMRVTVQRYVAAHRDKLVPPLAAPLTRPQFPSAPIRFRTKH